ncbi:unnamed protein product [Cuscuta europaea]|uniref:Uncharacterized protein n=1 Tax=Cuscuta europaea TaxID=41803 RepID=A0A9P0ZHU1_CUSEU|nr:unnamed protein product [Cuscuta europaea]
MDVRKPLKKVLEKPYEVELRARGGGDLVLQGGNKWLVQEGSSSKGMGMKQQDIAQGREGAMARQTGAIVVINLGKKKTGKAKVADAEGVFANQKCRRLWEA